MNRGLVWAFGGIAAVVAFLLWAGASALDPEKEGPTARPSSPAPTPAPSLSVAAQRERERLLRDDSLKPPSRNATAEEQRAYQAVLAEIQQGNDPLKALASGQPQVNPETQRRLEARKKAAEEHRLARKERSDAMRERMLKEREEKKKANEGRVLPPPLLPPPQLGPPVTGLEDPEKSPK